MYFDELCLRAADARRQAEQVSLAADVVYGHGSLLKAAEACEWALLAWQRYTRIFHMACAVRDHESKSEGCGCSGHA